MGFEYLPLKLSELGFFNFFAPFALVFLITLGILLKYKPFGEWKDSTAIQLSYGIVSFIVALFVTLYGLHVYIEMFLAWTLGRAGLIIILLLMAVIIAAIAKGGEKLGGE